MSKWRTVPYHAGPAVRKKRVKRTPDLLAEMRRRKREEAQPESSTPASKKKGEIKITPATAGDVAVNAAMDGIDVPNTAEEENHRKEKIPPIVVSVFNEEEYGSLCDATQSGAIKASFSFAS